MKIGHLWQLPMTYLVILLLFSAVVSLLIVRHKKHSNVIPTNWPILGMIPGIFVNAHRLHDYTTEILIQTHGTFMFKGPWFVNMDTLLTTNPLDIHHILSKNFSNYPKGEKLHKIFDVLGDGVINSDGKKWEIQRKIIFSVLHQGRFRSMMEEVIWNKVENGLLPILRSICERDTQIDLHDIFQRFAFDTSCKLLFNNDPKSLSLDFPSVPYSEAITDGEEAILLRHVTPPFLWKLQQVFRVGKEKKMSDGWEAFDQFIYKWLAQKENEYNSVEHEAEEFSFFTAIMRELKGQSGISSDPTKFLRDTYVNLMAAGKDTISSSLSWFFYLLAENSSVEDKILEEIRSNLTIGAGKKWDVKKLDEMVYLHGALCESLRLYPAIPFNRKSPLQPEILPSGHKVDQNMYIILSFYSMGRMKSIWGEDCAEFKPERWISSSGGIKHEPSYKLPTFSAGPRTCLGKNTAMSHLKIVATMIIYHYHVRLVEGHPVIPGDSIVLSMKHGLKVRLNKRSELN